MSSHKSQESESKRQDCNVTDADGPQPMKNFKPAETTPNSADQFREAHEAEYEARGRPSRDDVERARRHYAAYPKLTDELERRRSTTRCTAVRVRREMTSDSVCSVCRKLRRRGARKKILRSRGQSRRNRRYRTRERQYGSNRSVRVIYRRKRDGKKYRGNQSPSKGVVSPREGSVSGKGNKSRSDVGSLKNPSTAESSVSSYHSYPSMDHEPMV